jgi:4,5-DOPA dioxygenase extradiol
MATFPTLFISHGSPDTVIANTAATDFMKRYAASLPRPKAIVIASAHFEVQGGVAVSHDAKPQMIYDFGGFAPELYQIVYPAPGDPALAERIARSLELEGFYARAVDGRGFDHGTWVPLKLLYPEADIPVVQVSVDPLGGPTHHLRLGQALAKLRKEDILVIGSGSFTHNLREAFTALRAGERAAKMPDWVSGFIGWMDKHIAAGDEPGLLAYRANAPYAHENHPTEEHLMPLYVAIGAAGAGWKAEKIHESHEFGVLSMDAFAFT